MSLPSWVGASFPPKLARFVFATVKYYSQRNVAAIFVYVSLQFVKYRACPRDLYIRVLLKAV